MIYAALTGVVLSAIGGGAVAIGVQRWVDEHAGKRRRF